MGSFDRRVSAWDGYDDDYEGKDSDSVFVLEEVQKENGPFDGHSVRLEVMNYVARVPGSLSRTQVAGGVFLGRFLLGADP